MAGAVSSQQLSRKRPTIAIGLCAAVVLGLAFYLTGVRSIAAQIQFDPLPRPYLAIARRSGDRTPSVLLSLTLGHPRLDSGGAVPWFGFGYLWQPKGAQRAWWPLAGWVPGAYDVCLPLWILPPAFGLLVMLADRVLSAVLARRRRRAHRLVTGPGESTARFEVDRAPPGEKRGHDSNRS